MTREVEAGRYAREFMAVLVSVSIQPIGPILSGPSGENQIGVMVGMKDPEHPSANATAFTNALKQAGFTPTTPKTSDDMPADFGCLSARRGSYKSSSRTPSNSSAAIQARKNVAANVPRASLFAIDGGIFVDAVFFQPFRQLLVSLRSALAISPFEVEPGAIFPGLCGLGWHKIYHIYDIFSCRTRGEIERKTYLRS